MPPGGETAGDLLELLDWKRCVSALYAEVRASADPRAAWQRWRDRRDDLFRCHPQSPLPAGTRAAFAGLDLYPYDPALRVTAEVVGVPARAVPVGASRGEPIAFERFAEARFSLAGGERSLELYWLGGYGGGLFLPFRDATNGDETYGGGRYLLDTVKGADLGTDGGRLVLDFNFAYNPSCSHDPRWACPLSPPANRLPVRVRAGERAPRD